MEEEEEEEQEELMTGSLGPRRHPSNEGSGAAFASAFASAFAAVVVAVVVVAGERVSGSAANDGLLLIRSGGVRGGVFTSVWNKRR